MLRLSCAGEAMLQSQANCELEDLELELELEQRSSQQAGRRKRSVLKQASAEFEARVA